MIYFIFYVPCSIGNLVNIIETYSVRKNVYKLIIHHYLELFKIHTQPIPLSQTAII